MKLNELMELIPFSTEVDIYLTKKDKPIHAKYVEKECEPIMLEITPKFYFRDNLNTYTYGDYQVVKVNAMKTSVYREGIQIVIYKGDDTNG